MSDSIAAQAHPLTVAQRGLWMASFIAPPGSTFNIAEAIELPGAIDESAFVAALAQVATEIETLRSRIIDSPTGPRQEILPEYPGMFDVLDLRAEPDPRRAAEQWMAARLRAPVDMQRDPLWQNALLRTGDSHYIWFHCCHHAVLDGYSGGLVAARVAALYTAGLAGQPADPPPFLPLLNLAEQDSLYRTSERHAADRAYWLGQLADPPPALSLSRRPQARPTGDDGGFISRALMLDQARTDELASLAKRFETTLPQALTALIVGYLHRVTGVRDLVVGMPVSGRANRVLRNTPGMVANAVTLRFRFDAETDFVGLMAQSRRAMRSALRHQQFRYEDLRKELGLFETSQQIARIGINIEPFDYRLEFGAVEARNRNLSNGAMEDLTVFVFDRKDGTGLTVQFDANPALYDTAELDAHLARFDALAGSLIENPQIPLSAHRILSEADLRQVGQRARSAARVWAHSHLDTMLRTALTARPSAIAIIDAQGEITHGVLWQQIRTFATELRERGIGAGDLVAIGLPRDRRMVVVVAAIALAGAAWLPIDVNGPVLRTQAILDDARPALVVSAILGGLAPDTMRPWLLLAGAASPLDGAMEFPGGPVTPVAREAVVPARTAYVTYTSGTTGRPKGVIVPHAALANFLGAMADILDIDEATRLLAVTTLTFDIAALELLLPLVCGGSIVIAAREDVRDPGRISQLIERHRVDLLQATPTLWQSLLTHRDGEALRGLMLLTGGEMLPAHLARRLYGLGRAVFNLYGPTETTIWSTAHRLGAADLDDPPVGLPIANTELFILDPQGRPLPDGVIGELAIGGDGVASGYLGRPDLTAERFVADPHGRRGLRAYRTGDRAMRAPSGIVRLLGREDDQIKIRGMRIEPGEIETVLLGLEVVAQAAVVAERDTPQSAPVLAAYVVAQAGVVLDPAALRQRLLATLPGQMVPTRILAVEALPRNSSGKLDRASLRALAAPLSAGPQAVVTARTPAERMLAELWGALLGLDEIDVHANFFDLGGDSLLVLQLVAGLAERGFDLPIGQVFTVPTIAALAPFFEGRAVAVDPLAELVPIRDSGDRGTIFCISPVIGVGWGFAALASLLPDHYRVYALQHARMAQGAPHSLDVLAARHLDEIRRVQPAGPYHLVGWSMGGVIAHAVAALLQEEGEEIATLALLDAYPYHEDAARLPLDGPAAVRAAMDFLAIGLAPGVKEPRSLDALADTILEAELAHLSPGLSAPGGRVDALAASLRQATLHNLGLLRAHRPVRIDQDLLFVRAARRGGHRAGSLIHDRAEIWQRHTSGRVVMHDLDCRHQDMLQPGPVEQLAALLGAHLAIHDRLPRRSPQDWHRPSEGIEATL